MVENTTCNKKAVRLSSVSFSYGREAILKSINLDVQESEFIVILGESGSGKTTLLKIINSLLIGSGKVEV